jgi:hypothetical protein
MRRLAEATHPLMPAARSSLVGPTKSSSWPRRIFATSGSSEALVHGVALGLACLFSYEVTTHLLRGVHSVPRSDGRLGGMWAVIATVIVYRDSQSETFVAAISRMAATAVSAAQRLGSPHGSSCVPRRHGDYVDRAGSHIGSRCGSGRQMRRRTARYAGGGLLGFPEGGTSSRVRGGQGDALAQHRLGDLANRRPG